MTSSSPLGRTVTSPTLKLRRVIVRDLELISNIGVYDHEREGGQLIRINLEIDVALTPIVDRLDDAVSYEKVVDGIKEMIARGHINLVETLAERIADLCLKDTRAVEARVRIEKLHAVAEALGVGAEVVKIRRLDSGA